jgi:hypothetical protein
MIPSARRVRWLVLVGVACGLAAGCAKGPTLTPVRGTLTKGAQPVADVMIQLAPDNAGPEAKVAYGHTNAAGAFVMKTLPHGDGVVPGTYRVTLQPGDGTPALRLVPGKFQDLSQTPWRLTVPPTGLDGLRLDMTKDGLAAAPAK